MALEIKFESISKQGNLIRLKLFFTLRIQKLKQSLEKGSEFEESMTNSIELNEKFLRKIEYQLKHGKSQ